LEIRFHKHQVSFLVVKTVKCKRGKTVNCYFKMELRPLTGNISVAQLKFLIVALHFVSCNHSTAELHDQLGKWLLKIEEALPIYMCLFHLA